MQTNSFELRRVKDIMELEKRERSSLTLSDHLSDQITAFAGSMIYVVLHILWFAFWVLWNSGILGLPPFDPFPFSLLTMIVSLEAIFLSSFVLISQNRQARQADRQAKIDLEINMLAEAETTQLIRMITEIQKHLGIRQKDKQEIKELEKMTDINEIAKELEKAESEKKNTT